MRFIVKEKHEMISIVMVIHVRPVVTLMDGWDIW
jgi:hypothetical protein